MTQKHKLCFSVEIVKHFWSLSRLKGEIVCMYLNVSNLYQGCCTVVKWVWEEKLCEMVNKCWICAGHSLMQCGILREAGLGKVLLSVCCLCDGWQQATGNVLELLLCDYMWVWDVRVGGWLEGMWGLNWTFPLSLSPAGWCCWNPLESVLGRSFMWWSETKSDCLGSVRLAVTLEKSWSVFLWCDSCD